MAERRPIVLINGDLQELPSGDTLPGGGGSAEYPSFTGNSGKHLAINNTEDDVEWVDPPEGGGGSAGAVDITITDLPVPNGNFESGDITSWTLLTGSTSIVAATSSWGATVENGSYLLSGGSQALYEIQQDLDISTDQNVLFYEIRFDALKDWNDEDHAGLIAQFLDSSDNVLAEVRKHDTNLVAGKSTYTMHLVRQPSAVTLRLIVFLDRDSGTNNNCAIDNIEASKVSMTGANTLLNGTVDPTTEGIDGDFYYRTDTNTIFGPKNGTWPAGVSLVGPAGTDGQGVPVGGTAGQILAKIDATNYNTEWINPPSGGSYDMRFRFSSPPAAGAVIDTVIIVRDMTFPANLAGSLGVIGTNPAASFVLGIEVDSTQIATVTIGTDGSFTFSTTGGTSQSVPTGSVLTLVGPTPSDGSIADMALTLYGIED